MKKCIYVLCIKFGANCSILWAVYAVCDDTCREVVMDTANDIVVCTISGHCFDRLLVLDEEPDAVSISQPSSYIIFPVVNYKTSDLIYIFSDFCHLYEA